MTWTIAAPRHAQPLATLLTNFRFRTLDPVSHVFSGEGTQHVFYTADNGDIVEFWWNGGTNAIPQFENLNERTLADAPPGTTRPGAPAPDGDPTSHVFDAENTQHVFYTTPDSEFSDLHELVELWFNK